MKILYIVNVRIPTEKVHGFQIMKMCENFSLQKINGNNIEIEFIVPRKINKIKEDPFDYYNIKRNFNIKYLPSIDLNLYNFGKIISKIGMIIQMISFLLVTRFYLLFKKYDLIYTREQEFAGIFWENYILEIHNFPESPSSLHKRCWSKAKALVVLTSLIKKRLVEYGIDEKKILVAPDAVDLNIFDINISKEDARKKINFPKDKNIILYTGSFYFDWKGIDILLQAEKFLDDNYLIVLAGGGKKEIEKIKKIYNTKKILLIERRPNKEIPIYLKSADILILPNKKGSKISEEYTSPLKLFEYMSSKRPVIASSLPSIREILNKNNSFLIEPNNPQILAEAIIKVSKDDIFSKKISNKAYEDVKKFTWQKRAENIINFIEKK